MRKRKSCIDPRPALVLVCSEGEVLEVWFQGRYRDLTGRERLLLAFLARNVETVVLRERLEEELYVGSNGLYDLVYDLRNKLGRHYICHRGGRARRGSGSSSGYVLTGVKVTWVQSRVSNA